MTDATAKTALDINELKAGGFIKERQGDLFTLRIRVPAGRITSEKLKKIAEIAERHGTGLLHTTVRQSLEILHVDRAAIDRVRRDLEEAGLSIASCGPRVRVPTACSGCDYNPNGITDTVKVCLE
ncbi:MAG: sulfite reductase, partial [Dehalococcoidia bacterium]|nr:sulfite reductase [Dehalococcoidia bacterium]